VSICLPPCVQILGPRCFSSCRSLSQVRFEASSKLRHIHDGVFTGCSSLTSVHIPPTLRILFQSYLNPSMRSSVASSKSDDSLPQIELICDV
jgi:hypothetical protein